MKKVLLLATRYSLLATFIVGCASTPTISRAYLKDKIVVDGTSYIPAQSLCSIYDLDYHWDPITKEISLVKDDKVAKMMVASSLVLLGKTVHNMDREVKFYQDRVLIPHSFVRRSLALFLREEYTEYAGRRMNVTSLTPIRRVIIDPGHGGKDPGAVGRGGLKEKDVVLDIAQRLKRKLNAAGIKAISTRDSDRFVSLARRSKIANANAEEVNFFISIHANASRSRWVSGVEVFYLSEGYDDSQRSLAAAKNYNLTLKEDYCGRDTAAILWDLKYTDDRKSSIELAKFVCRALSKRLSQRNRGKKPARFYVLKTNMPAILVEVGFISNVREEKRLRQAAYRDKIAAAIAEGIVQYNRNFMQRYTLHH